LCPWANQVEHKPGKEEDEEEVEEEEADIGLIPNSTGELEGEEPTEAEPQEEEEETLRAPSVTTGPEASGEFSGESEGVRDTEGVEAKRTIVLLTVTTEPAGLTGVEVEVEETETETEVADEAEDCDWDGVSDEATGLAAAEAEEEEEEGLDPTATGIGVDLGDFGPLRILLPLAVLPNGLVWADLRISNASANFSTD
jgi:hypothetical protein